MNNSNIWARTPHAHRPPLDPSAFNTNQNPLLQMTQSERKQLLSQNQTPTGEGENLPNVVHGNFMTTNSGKPFTDITNQPSKVQQLQEALQGQYCGISEKSDELEAFAQQLSDERRIYDCVTHNTGTPNLNEDAQDIDETEKQQIEHHIMAANDLSRRDSDNSELNQMPRQQPRDEKRQKQQSQQYGGIQMFNDQFQATGQTNNSMALDRTRSMHQSAMSNHYNSFQVREQQNSQPKRDSESHQPEDHHNDTLDMIKQYLKQLSFEMVQKFASNKQAVSLEQMEQFKNLINGRIFDQLKFNTKNKLLSLVDADLLDYQLEFFISTIQIIQAALGDNICIKGLNLNQNSRLTDLSMRHIIGYVRQTKSIKVLSIERMNISHQAVLHLFQALPKTRIIELNISGIPLNFVCIDCLCNILNNNTMDLRVLHLRNTKLQDSSGLRIMEQILINKSKIKYLNLASNIGLGFQFQNGIIKMMREVLAQGEKHHVKFLDLKQCKINSKNLELISKLIAHNNGLLTDREGKSLKRLLNSHKSSRSQRNSSAELGKVQKGTGSRGSFARISFDGGTRQESKNSPLQFQSNGRMLPNGSIDSQSSIKKEQSIDQIKQQMMFRHYGNDNQDSIQEIVIHNDQEDQLTNNFKTSHSQTKKKQKSFNLVDSHGDLHNHVKYSQSCNRQLKSKSLCDIKGMQGTRHRDANQQQIGQQTLIKNINQLRKLNAIGTDQSQYFQQSQDFATFHDLPLQQQMAEQGFKPKYFNMTTDKSRDHFEQNKLDRKSSQASIGAIDAYGGQRQKMAMDQTFQMHGQFTIPNNSTFNSQMYIDSTLETVQHNPLANGVNPVDQGFIRNHEDPHSSFLQSNQMSSIDHNYSVALGLNRQSIDDLNMNSINELNSHYVSQGYLNHRDSTNNEHFNFTSNPQRLHRSNLDTQPLQSMTPMNFQTITASSTNLARFPSVTNCAQNPHGNKNKKYLARSQKRSTSQKLKSRKQKSASSLTKLQSQVSTQMKSTMGAAQHKVTAFSKSSKDFKGPTSKNQHNGSSDASRSSFTKKRNSMPNLKNSRVVNIDFHAQPSETINLIIKSHPSYKDFKPELPCQQSQLTDFLQRMCKNLQKQNRQMRGGKKFIRVDRSRTKSKKRSSSQLNRSQSNKAHEPLPQQVNQSFATLAPRSNCDLSNDYLRRSTIQQPNSRVKRQNSSKSPHSKSKQASSKSPITTWIPPGVSQSPAFDKDYTCLRMKHRNHVSQTHNSFKGQTSNNFEQVKQATGPSQKSSIKSTMPNSVVQSHRIPDNCIDQQALQNQLYAKFRQMVPDKPHPQTYAAKSKKHQAVSKEPKKTKSSKRSTGQSSRFSFANARSSLGLVNQSMQLDDYGQESMQEYNCENYHYQSAQPVQTRIQKPPISNSQFGCRQIEPKRMQEFQQIQSRGANIAQNPFQRNNVALDKNSQQQMQNHVNYGNQLSSKNLTERNESNPLTSNRINKVESEQELRKFGPYSNQEEQVHERYQKMVAKAVKQRHNNQASQSFHHKQSIGENKSNQSFSQLEAISGSFVKLNFKDNIKNVGQIQHMIKDEIARLESLYKNIELIIQPGAAEGDHCKRQAHNVYENHQKQSRPRASEPTEKSLRSNASTGSEMERRFTSLNMYPTQYQPIAHKQSMHR